MVGASAQAIEASVKTTMPMSEDPPPADAVAEPAADQHQRAEHQEIAVDHPLQAGDVGAEGRAGSPAARC